MKKSYIIILVLLLAIAAYFFLTDTQSTIKTEYSNFAFEDTSKITRIFIADHNGEKADLSRQENNSWKINDAYKARQDAIDLILRSLKLIKVKEPVPESARNTIITQMAGRSIKVEFYAGEDKPVRVYYIGNPTQNHFGTYMLLEIDGQKSSVPFITHIPGFHGYLTARFFTEQDTWRDRAVFNLSAEEIETVSIKYNERPLKSFKLEREGEDYLVTDLSSMMPLENQRSDGFEEYLSRFKSIHYEFIQREAPLANIDSVLATKPLHEIEVTTRDGKKVEVITFFKPVKFAEAIDPRTGEPYTYDIDRLFAWINKEDFVVMQWPTIDNILAYNDDFREQ